MRGLLAATLVGGVVLWPAHEACGSDVAGHPREQTYLKREWGVEVLHVRQAAAGYMLELRYRVLDVEKAGPLFRRDTKPVLTHAESGAELIVTDHNEPVLRIVPIRRRVPAAQQFADVRGRVVYHEDVTTPTTDEWPDS